ISKGVSHVELAFNRARHTTRLDGNLVVDAALHLLQRHRMHFPVPQSTQQPLTRIGGLLDAWVRSHCLFADPNCRSMRTELQSNLGWRPGTPLKEVQLPDAREPVRASARDRPGSDLA